MLDRYYFSYGYCCLFWLGVTELMNIGDTIESAIWVTGEESPEDRTRYEQDVCDAIGYLCHENGFVPGSVTFIEKHPMDDDVPEVPDHIQGEKVRLLVGESIIDSKLVKTSVGSFVANLDIKDLKKLRSITRQAARRQLSNMECDEIIEQIGPEAALNTLRKLH